MEALAMNPKAKTGVENHKAGELSGPLNFQAWSIGEGRSLSSTISWHTFINRVGIYFFLISCC